jgi:hypothetical protein
MQLGMGGSPSGRQAIIGSSSGGASGGMASGGSGSMRAPSGSSSAASGMVGGGGARGGATAAAGQGAVRGSVEQRTMIADDVQAPRNVPNMGTMSAPGPASYTGRPPVGKSGTMIADDVGGMMPPQTSGGGHQGTMMLPDSAGVIAFAAEQAAAARRAAGQVQVDPVKPAGPLFWTAWVVLGIGIGLAAHFVQIREQVAPTAAEAAAASSPK